MARSAGRWMAMPSEGWRAVTGEFIIDHGEGMRAFGVGVKHRTEAQDVTTLGERTNDEGAIAPGREARAGDATRIMASRDVRRMHSCRGSKRPSWRSRACGEPDAKRRRADRLKRRSGARAAMARQRRAASRDTGHGACNKADPSPGSEEPA